MSCKKNGALINFKAPFVSDLIYTTKRKSPQHLPAMKFLLFFLYIEC
ncbi:hypothetical protein HDE69_000800 [Pedobacter cryoconitis]|uniref:Uncharacterized protein n=1 Tax=Pedobacter cryoconitis TaxID=188932 RepID=A0A7W9DI68_9SPHI|nr:hypothetical protein [Pedobacter cryoconitis]